MREQKKIIIFTDSGDTIIDEATQQYREDGIVTTADFIEDAGEVLQRMDEAGYTIALVADGEEESFQNVYRENGLKHCFDAWVVSETVGQQKPAQIMFQTAMDQLGLTDADTMDAPVFPEVWAEAEPLIAGLPLVAHNSRFDEGCLKAVFRMYRMDYPDYRFFCTCNVSRRMLRGILPDHRLPTVAAYCGYSLARHHNALADAEACAAIAMKLIPDSSDIV